MDFFSLKLSKRFFLKHFILLLLRVLQIWIRITCGFAHLHIKSFITTKFYKILLSGFRGVALTNCFSSIFHFGQISKFKKGVTPRKKNWIKISCGYAHLHIMSFITTKFHEILLSSFTGVALTRKTGLTDWLTVGRVKNLIPSATRCVGYNNEEWRTKKRFCLFYLYSFVCLTWKLDIKWNKSFTLQFKFRSIFIICTG